MNLAPLFLMLFAVSLFGGEVKVLHLDPPPFMTRAELYYLKNDFTPRAVLVLCPGCNGSGEGLIHSKIWQDFAKKNDLGLVGLSFASPMEAIQDGTGYYYASNGSGKTLLEGIKLIYGKSLPLVLYGFSGGAHFTSRFVEWNPREVITWSAYSAGWWDVPMDSAVNPPGVIACGDEDFRYGASLSYFKQGRTAGKPWLWVSLQRTEHAGSVKLDEFIMRYFTTVLKQRFQEAVYIDIDREIVVSEAEAKRQPTLTGWLPSRKLMIDWSEVHEP